MVTGAPGTGKSAVLAAIGDGLHRVVEPARPVLAELRAKGLDPSDPDVFVEAILARSIASYRSMGHGQPVVFDRGIPDCIAYAEWLGADPAPSREAAQRYPYHPTVMVFRPWEAIYTTDEERTMSFEATVAWQPIFERIYGDLGYELIEVPRAPIEDRARFVAATVATDG